MDVAPLLTAAALACTLVLARAQTPAGALAPVAAQGSAEVRPLTAERAADVAYIVRGIVKYTRWAPLPAPIRLCVSDDLDAATETAFVRAMQDGRDGAAPIALASRRLTPASIPEPSECHVVLVNSAAPWPWRGLLLALLDRPVLTIGFDEEFCSIGGMFCLDDASGKLAIRANLDSIARSGMRINPQLLRLTQQRHGGR